MYWISKVPVVKMETLICFYVFLDRLSNQSTNQSLKSIQILKEFIRFQMYTTVYFNYLYQYAS